MPILPLETMTVEEKLQAMETIWDDLCRQPESIVSPPWHGQELAEREAALLRGEDVFEDWEAVKRDLEEELS